MAKLRKFTAYRRRESRPFTRKSKYREKSFIRASPTCKIIRFDMGNLKSDFDYAIHLSVSSELQIRHNALESARLTANRTLEKGLGKSGFHLKLRTYPHHFLRENPLASGAGADRMSTGMKCAFGKIIGLAAQFKEGQKLFTVRVNSNGLKLAKLAMQKASKKLPCKCKVSIESLKESVKPEVVEEVVVDNQLKENVKKDNVGSKSEEQLAEESTQLNEESIDASSEVVSKKEVSQEE